MAVETPFRGIRVLTRSGQGLLNQEIEMNKLLAKVLEQEITEGNVKIQADDGQAGGKTVEETFGKTKKFATNVENYKQHQKTKIASAKRCC